MILQRGAALLGALVAVLLGAAVPASADGAQIDHVESAADGRATVLLALPAGADLRPGSVRITVDGAEVRDVELVGASSVQRTTMLVLDTSRSMRGRPIAAAREAADRFLAAVPADVRVGLVTFDGAVETVVTPTTDRGRVRRAVAEVELALGTRLYDGVTAAVRAAGKRGAGSLLVLSDGRDDGRGASLSQALAAAKAARTSVDVVALGSTASARQGLARLASGTGGAVTVADEGGVGGVFAARARDLVDQVGLRFTAPSSGQGSADISVSATLSDGTVVSDETYAPLAAAPRPPARTAAVVPAESAPISGVGTLTAGIAALTLALGSLVYLALGSKRRGPSLATTIDHFTGSPQLGTRAVDRGSLKESAVEAADKMLSGDFESRIRVRLEGAGSALTPAEWLLLHAAIAVGSALFGAVLGGAGSAIVFLCLGVTVPWVSLRWRHSRRKKAFGQQLADSLQLMAGGLQAGLSMPQAIDTVAREAAEPMAGELRRALVVQRLGVDLTDALEQTAERMESTDARWVVMAMRIQREVGGNLAELLLTVAATLRERDDIRRQVSVLAAEGKVSAYVLGGLPIAMFAYMMLVRREVARLLYTEPLGIVMLVVAALMLAMGLFWMSRMTKIEV